MAKKEDLTKEEISELSQALDTESGSAGAESKEANAYDFAHPDKLSKVNLRALQIIFSSLERPWTNTLSFVLRNEITVQIGTLEQTKLGAYAESIPAASVIAAIEMDLLPGVAFIDMPSALALGITNRLVGGKGNVPDSPRALTQIELNVIKRLVTKLCADLREAWRQVGSVHFSVSEMHQSMDEIEFDPAALFITFSTTWNVNTVDYRVNIAVPVNALDPVLEELNPHKWMKKNANAGNAQAMIELLDTIGIATSVELGHTQLSMEELLSMEVGDVISLDRKVDDLLDIKIGSKTAFHARPGLVGKKISVQIKDIVGEADNTIVNQPVTGSE